MLEAVPNVSEGRDAARIDAIAQAFAARAEVLDVHSDPDHHRSVLTLAAEPGALVDALVAGTSRTLELVDLREHDGVHPRVGAVDVVPLVALAPGDAERAREAARATAERLGDELGLPVFLYAEVGAGRRPAFFRRGGLAALVARVEAGELLPDYGPRRIDARHGVALVGARPPLVAYNVELGTDDPAIAGAIAIAVRESGGGMSGVQAIGLRLARGRRIQVSMNVLDLARAPLHEVFLRVAAEAEARGVAIAGGELVGLVPAQVVAEAETAGVAVPGVDPSRTIEHALGSRLEP